MDITPLLQHAQNPDAAVRNQAEQQLKQLEEQNAAAYLSALASELANSQKPADARQIAGLILKNALDAGDEKKKVRHFSSLLVVFLDRSDLKRKYRLRACFKQC